MQFRLDIGFTGTRLGMSSYQKDKVRTLLSFLKDKYQDRVVYFRHGDCVGADEEAHQIALDLGYNVIIHPPINSSNRANCNMAFSILTPEAYLDRNRKIVDKSSMLIAAPKKDEEQRNGTWSTIRYAKKNNCPVRIIYPI